MKKLLSEYPGLPEKLAFRFRGFLRISWILVAWFIALFVTNQWRVSHLFPRVLEIEDASYERFRLILMMIITSVIGFPIWFLESYILSFAAWLRRRWIGTCN
jgi:Kef-type K+ transport system membrane component KefB